MTDDQLTAYVQRGHPDYFRVYIAWKRLRTAMWGYFPPLVFVRWLVRKMS